MSVRRLVLAMFALGMILSPGDVREPPLRASTHATPAPAPLVERAALPPERLQELPADTGDRESARAAGTLPAVALAAASGTQPRKATAHRAQAAPVAGDVSAAPATSRALPRTANAAPHPLRRDVAPVPMPDERSEAFVTVLESDEFEGTMAPLARLYLAYFQRLPDFEGFQYYIDERDGGRPLDAIAEEFAHSREFAERYGALDNTAFIDRIAQNVLEHGLDPAQRPWWVAQLDSGALSRGQAVLALAESNGFRAATDNEVFVAIAYAETLQRAPDLADWGRWVAYLDAGHPRSALIAELLRRRNPG